MSLSVLFRSGSNGPATRLRWEQGRASLGRLHYSAGCDTLHLETSQETALSLLTPSGRLGEPKRKCDLGAGGGSSVERDLALHAGGPGFHPRFTMSQMLWCTSVILALWWRQGEHKFKVILSKLQANLGYRRDPVSREEEEVCLILASVTVSQVRLTECRVVMLETDKQQKAFCGHAALCRRLRSGVAGVWRFKTSLSNTGRLVSKTRKN